MTELGSLDSTAHTAEKIDVQMSSFLIRKEVLACTNSNSMKACKIWPAFFDPPLTGGWALSPPLEYGQAL